MTALEKARGHLPGPERERVGLASPLLSPNTRGAESYKAHRETIATLCRAMLERKRCLVEYQSPQRERPTRFRIDPYRLFPFKGGLYLFAYVPVHQFVLTLAVERIEALTPTAETFEIIQGFSFEARRDRAFGVFTAEKPVRVVVRFSKEVAPYVRERTWHPTPEIREVRNGDLRLSFRAGGRIEIVRWVLGWGSDARVLQPASLRREIAAEARKTAERDAYERPPGRDLTGWGLRAVGWNVVRYQRGHGTQAKAQALSGYIRSQRLLGRPGSRAHGQDQGVLGAAPLLRGSHLGHDER